MNNINRLINKPVIAIKAGSSALAKLTNAAILVINGIIVRIAAADLPALTTAASLATGEKNIVLFLSNVSGTTSIVFGTKSTTYAGIVLPSVNPATHVVLGGILITAAATFTGGTTALDATDITAEYFDADGLGATRFAL